jgi:hypothetical protein
MGEQSPDAGTLRLGDTVVPMYVDQSREALNSERTVFEELAGEREEVEFATGRSVNARAYASWCAPVVSLLGAHLTVLQHQSVCVLYIALHCSHMPHGRFRRCCQITQVQLQGG